MTQPPPPWSGEPEYQQQPQYPSGYQQGYNPQGYYPPGTPGPGNQPAGAGGTVTLGSLLGTRARRRPDARFGPALAAAGAALVITGGLVWSIGYFANGFGLDFGSDEDLGAPSVHGGGRRFLGFGLFLVLTVLGYALVIVRRRGPLATAGTVLSAFSVPLALAFVFLDLSDTFRGGAFPFNLDAVYLISIGVWIATYLAVPGARGRSLYLAAAAVGLPSYIAIKTAGNSTIATGFSAVSGNGLGGDGTRSSSHSGTVAAITLTFGLVYYVIAALLDRARRSGAAVGLLVAAFLTTASGISIGAHDFGQVGTGAVLVVIGVLVAIYGGRFGRRFTTWVWSAAAVFGVLLMVAELGTDRYVTIAVILIVVGAVVAIAAQFAPGVLHEEPDLVDEPVPSA